MDIVRSRSGKLNSTGPQNLAMTDVPVRQQLIFRSPARGEAIRSYYSPLSYWQNEDYGLPRRDSKGGCKLVQPRNLQFGLEFWRATCLSTGPITRVRSNGSLEGR